MSVEKNSKGVATPVVIGIIAVLAIIGGGIVLSQKSASSQPDAMVEEKVGDQAMVEKEGDAMMEEKSVEDNVVMENDEGTMKEKEGEVMMEKKDDVMMEEKMEEKEMVAKAPGSYEEYDVSKLAKADNGDVVLFFKASWCPSCRALEGHILSRKTEIPDGLAILTLDFDTETELRKKYGVTMQHTLVQVNSSGELIRKWIGSPTLTDLVENVQ